MGQGTKKGKRKERKEIYVQRNDLTHVVAEGALIYYTGSMSFISMQWNISSHYIK